MRYGTNKEKNTVRGGVMMTGKGEPWHTKERKYSNSSRSCLMFIQRRISAIWAI
jgi:hypothetical protein